jgi:hypothetical protein
MTPNDSLHTRRRPVLLSIKRSYASGDGHLLGITIRYDFQILLRWNSQLLSILEQVGYP